MKPLSGLDALFLYLETPATPMHVGALHRLELPAGYRGDYVDDVRALLAQRLHLSPVFTRTLAKMPLNFANPVWVRAATVDLQQHVRSIRLPKPGSQAQLEAAVARLHATLLDRSRPLWQFTVIEGLAGGGRAFYSKVHHATLDGASGVALAQAMLDVTAQPRAVEAARPRRRHAAPGWTALVGTGLKASGAQTLKLVTHLPDAARIALDLVRQWRAPGGGWLRNLAFGPRTPFNAAIEGARTIATASLPLDAVKRIARAHEVTLNDVVLTVIAGALRHWLGQHGGVPRKPLVVAMPVSLREAGNTDATTMATMTLVRIATEVADPLARLAAVRDSAAAAKALTQQLRSVTPTDFPSLGVPWLLSTAAALYGRARVADRIPPLANLVVSNVPGPPMPLYLAGARLLTYWPLSIVEHGLGLNITLQSYAGSLDFGLVGARNVLPDLRGLAAALPAAFDELVTATAAQWMTRPVAPSRAKPRGTGATGASSARRRVRAGAA